MKQLQEQNITLPPLENYWEWTTTHAFSADWSGEGAVEKNPNVVGPFLSEP